MNMNNKSISILQEIKWNRLCLTFICKKTSTLMKSHPVSVFQAIIKAVSSRTPAFSSPDNRIMPIFHIRDKKHSYKMNPCDRLRVDFFFFRPDLEEISLWRQNLIEYLAEPVYSETVEILSIGEIEERNYRALSAEFGELPAQGEICLEFLIPLSFKPERGKTRVSISKHRFIELFEKHFSDLFAETFKYEPGEDDFIILPYYWRYTEIKHTSKSQPGNTQYINGVIGKLYLKGNWQNFLPFLALGSELHIGRKFTNSQGYYKLLPGSVPYFKGIFPDAREVMSVTRDVIENYDHACEWLSRHGSYPFDEKVFADELCEELKNDRYLPAPNTAFVIRQKNKKDRVVEQVNFKDLIVSRYLLMIIYRVFDNIFEEESIGSRKGFSRQRAIEMVKSAVEEGYEYIIESDIEDFFPSVELADLQVLLERYLPSKDGIIKSLLGKLIGNGYILEGRYHERVKGLALGNPLSPCLANLYLDSFDEYIKAMDVRLVRYVDDFIIFCKSPEDAEMVLSETRSFLSEIGLKLKAEKTVLKSVSEGFSFLGFTFKGKTVEETGEEIVKLFKKPLYIIEPYVFISMSSGTVVLKKDQVIIDTIPLGRISEIMVMEKTVFSTAIIRYCVENRIPFTITLNNGYYITTIKPDSKNYYNIAAVHTQKYGKLTETECLCIAKEFAAGKIRNFKALFVQKHVSSNWLDEIVSQIYQAGDIFQVRGIEGMAARKTFERLNEHIKSPDFQFKKRMRQHPDRINSLLNFGYYLLFSRINSTVRAMGLNPYLGFLHSPGDNYESLVCDIQELFRARINRLILRLINKKIITGEDFQESKNGFYLNKEGVTRFINHFEGEMNRKHTKASLSLKEHIYVQVTVIKNWVMDDKSLTFYEWDISKEPGGIG
ncbi:MAG: CRISPR-associated endonuclease Cas1 [Candidatus Aminicenantes bacterium]|nr:CRISPR-associated endonuclease Cas1 [Candidatus Aminicenantes bacterium]